MNKTKIEWCTMTWNSVTGCLHICEYCYARRIAYRFAGYDKTSESNSEIPIEAYSENAVIAALKYPLLKITKI